ncbi:MAG: phosphoenolpyruvate carboxykinase, partial [Phaeodactylibacter sp.]|nr:phosphoenolpyruvate carboxykinase [Phaeodactylibacter sp.]
MFEQKTFPGQSQAAGTRQEIQEWVDKMSAFLQPAKVHWVTGTEEENQQLLDLLVEKDTFIRLNPQKRPGSYACFSDPSDVARVEDRTFINSRLKEDAGPTNNWTDPKEMKATLEGLMEGCMKGRTMYVIPFCMGPLGCRFSRYGIQLTDSEYVVVNMRIMTRMGTAALEAIDGDYVRCVHTVGAPLEAGQEDVPWPCNPTTKYITHFPEDRLIISYGSGYGGNALLGK